MELIEIVTRAWNPYFAVLLKRVGGAAFRKCKVAQVSIMFCFPNTLDAMEHICGTDFPRCSHKRLTWFPFHWAFNTLLSAYSRNFLRNWSSQCSKLLFSIGSLENPRVLSEHKNMWCVEVNRPKLKKVKLHLIRNQSQPSSQRVKLTLPSYCVQWAPCQHPRNAERLLTSMRSKLGACADARSEIRKN